VQTPEAGLRQQFELSMRIKRVLDQREAVATTEFQRLVGELQSLYGILQGSDAAPTVSTVQLVSERLRAAEGMLGRTD